MSGTIALVAMTITFLVAIYLITKGVEIVLRGTRPSNPTRGIDLLFGSIMLFAGAVAGVIGFFWLMPVAVK